MTYNSIKYGVSYCLKKLFQFVKAIDIEYSLFPCLCLVIIERNQIRRFLNIDLSPFTIIIIVVTQIPQLNLKCIPNIICKSPVGIKYIQDKSFFFSVESKNYGTLSFKENWIHSTMWK